MALVGLYLDSRYPAMSKLQLQPRVISTFLVNWILQCRISAEFLSKGILCSNVQASLCVQEIEKSENGRRTEKLEVGWP